MRIFLITFSLLINFALFVSPIDAYQAHGKATRKAHNTDKVADTPSDTPSAPTGPPVVKQVLSGDLLELESGEMLRLMGADAPVMSTAKQVGQQPWADEAKKFTEQMCLGKEITINDLGLKNDEYGRRIGLVYIGDLWLDYELVKNGFAVVQPNPYLKNQEKQALVDAQREARSGYRGIWNYTNPLKEPPREFRAANQISEGDDSKADSWKRAATSTATSTSSSRSPRSNRSSSNSTSSNDGNSSGSTSSSTGTATGNSGSASSSLEAAAATLDALAHVQDRIDAGVKSGELSRLVSAANDRYNEIPLSSTDHELAVEIKDAVDAYQLVLDAFKRKETASDADRPRFTKYIDGALEIAEKAITAATQRLSKLNKLKH